jgi:hypothetical protein
MITERHKRNRMHGVKRCSQSAANWSVTTPWPELDHVISPDSGHSSHEPGITKELVAATDRIAETGSPNKPGSVPA